MKPKLNSLITTLLFAPLVAFSQAKPEVANATKAAKRAWESAPDEKKALWQQQREALKHIDLSEDTQRQTVIARGSPTPGEYHAHPTTALLADNKTMFCVWNIGHGGHAGLTWTPPSAVLFPSDSSASSPSSPSSRAAACSSMRTSLFTLIRLTRRHKDTKLILRMDLEP